MAIVQVVKDHPLALRFTTENHPAFLGRDPETCVPFLGAGFSRVTIQPYHAELSRLKDGLGWERPLLGLIRLGAEITACQRKKWIGVLGLDIVLARNSFCD